MEVKLNICKLGGEKSCAIRISDATTDFLPEDSSTPVFQRFKRSEVKSIDVVRFNAVNETKILRVFISDIDLSNVFEIKEDGWYDVHHIVLPTKEWFDQALEDGGMIYTYDTVYYIDNEKFYKYKDAVTTEICIEEILESLCQGEKVFIEGQSRVVSKAETLRQEWKEHKECADELERNVEEVHRFVQTE